MDCNLYDTYGVPIVSMGCFSLFFNMFTSSPIKATTRAQLLMMKREYLDALRQAGNRQMGRRRREGEDGGEPVLVGFLLCCSDSIWTPVCGGVLSSPLDTSSHQRFGYYSFRHFSAQSSRRPRVTITGYRDDLVAKNTWAFCTFSKTSSQLPRHAAHNHLEL